MLPKDLVRKLGIRPNDSVRIEIERAAGLEEVSGRLAKYGLSVSEWNDATNEGEEL